MRSGFQKCGVGCLLLAVFALAGCSREPAGTALQTGMDLLKQEKPREAIGHLERAVRLLPDSATAHANLGIACWKNGQDSRAVDEFHKAAELNRSDPQPLEFIGAIQLKAGRLKEARQALDEAFLRSVPGARILTAMASLEIQATRYDHATTCLKQALLLEPSYGPALFNYGVLCREKSNKAEATLWFEKFLKAGGDAHHLHQARLFLQLPEGSAVPAGVATNAAIKLEAAAPASPAAPLLAAARSALDRQEYDEALVMLNQAIKKDPKNADALWTLAVLYDKHLKYSDSAKQIYRKFDQLFPDDARARPRQVTGAAKTVSPRDDATPPPSDPGQKPTTNTPAVAEVKPPTVQEQAAAQELFREGVMFHKAQNWSEAITHYRKALNLDRNFVDAAYNLGLACKNNGDLEMARDAFLYTLSVKPDMTKANYMLAIVFTELKKGDKAIEQLHRVLKKEPDNAKAHYLLGLLYRADLQLDEARTHFEAYVKLAPPTEPSVREAREWLESVNNSRSSRR